MIVHVYGFRKSHFHTMSTELSNTELARAIRTARTALGFSQQALADAISVERQAVSLWETARGRPQPANLTALREVLGEHFTALEPVVGPQDLAYWRGRVSQMAVHLSIVLQEAQGIAADMAGGNTSLPVADQPQRRVFDAPRPAPPIKQARKLKGR